MFSEAKIILWSSNHHLPPTSNTTLFWFISAVWRKDFKLEMKVFFLLGISMLPYFDIGCIFPLQNPYFYTNIKGDALYTLHRNRLLVTD